MSGTRAQITLAIAVASLAALSPRSMARAQESGTLLSQTLTVQKNATDPVIQIQVTGFKSAGSTTRIFLEIGPDGNATIPAVDPALPGSAAFRIGKTGVVATKDFTPPAAGATVNDNGVTFPNKNVSVDRIVENAADPRGLYRIAIGHITDVTTTETWTLTLIGIPASMRVVASIDRGSFTSLTPVGACGGSTPTVCPACPNCKLFVPRIWLYYKIPDFVRPDGPPPPDCKVCGEIWGQRFDAVKFERALVSFTPTAAERAIITRDGMKVSPFAVTGGELIGSTMEGTSGQLYQMIQYPKGKPPLVGLSTHLAPPTDTTATPVGPRSSRNLLFGLGGLIIGALGGVAIARRGGSSDPRSLG